MTFVQYLRILRRQWFTVLLLAALATGASAAYTYRQTPMFAATTQLFVSVQGAQTDISDLQQGSTFTQQRVKSYADVVTSPTIAQAVILDLGLPYEPEELARNITVENPLDTVLLDVTVQDTNPDRAAAIANAVARAFPTLVSELERPAGRVTSPVKVSVTRQATAPDAPISPRLPLNLALGLLIGLGLGIGAAVLRDQLKTTVDGVADVEALTGGVPLGVVPFDSDSKSSPLITADQFGSRAEAFRTLRTNLQFADVDNPPRVFVVTSPLPSEGKTTTACNLSLTLALSGARVILVDGDLRKPSVGKYLGIDNAAGVSSVLAGRHELGEVIVRYSRGMLAVLPSGPMPPNPSELLGSQHMAGLLERLSADYDAVVIDAPPLLPVTDAAVLAALADGAVLVARHGKTRRDEVTRALQALSAVNAKLLGTVLNFAPRRGRTGGYDGYGYGYGGYGQAKQPVAEGPGGGLTPNAAGAPAAPPAANGSLVNGSPVNGSAVNGSAPGPVGPLPAPIPAPTSAPTFGSPFSPAFGAGAADPVTAPATVDAGLQLGRRAALAQQRQAGPDGDSGALERVIGTERVVSHAPGRGFGATPAPGHAVEDPAGADAGAPGPQQARPSVDPDDVFADVPWSQVVPDGRGPASTRGRRRVISRARN